MTNNKPVDWEDSVEGRAIARIAAIDENTEWITLEEVKQRLKERGYRTKIEVPNKDLTS